MEVVGVAANIIAVVDISVKVLSWCSQYAKDVKHANAEVQQLCNEVDQLRQVTENVRYLLDGPAGSRLQSSREMGAALQSSLDLLVQVEHILRPGSSRKVMSRIGLRALRWPFQSSESRSIIEGIRNCSARLSWALQVDQATILLDVDDKVGKVDDKIDQVNTKIDKVDNTLISVDQRMILEKLPTVIEASYNSHAEEHNSKCLENTRVELLQHIDAWVSHPQAPAIFWLNGMAGTGKSTISRTVAATSARRAHLGASFFFKRGEADRGIMSRFYTTVASQLIRSKPELVPYIKATLDNDPAIIGKSAGDQFDKLILQPLQQSRLSKTSTVIFIIDALDECDGDGDIRRLIDLFSRFRAISNLRIRALITSRPELPIRLGFNTIQGNYHNVVLHEIPETIVAHDLGVFFQQKLAEIRHDYNASVPEDRKLSRNWPGPNDIGVLVQMAVPLFIFAATICRFLSDRTCGNPNQQLQQILAYKTRSQESKMEATYLPPLEQQVRGLSAREQDRVLKDFRHIVGTIVVLQSPLPVLSLARLLDIERDRIDVRLDMLHSVLEVPKSANSPVRLLHLSFRDFLIDPEKQGTNPYWVDEKKTHGMIAASCIRLLSNSLKEDLCDLKLPGIDRSEVSPQRIASCLPAELQYACRHWADHLQNAGEQACSDQEVFDFLSQHFLHWLEVLSLIGRTSEGLHVIKTLESFMQDSEHGMLSELLKEGGRFIQTNLVMIDSSPLQLYSSLLTFTPESSMIRQILWDKRPKWMPLASAARPTWDQCQQVLEVKQRGINSIAFSANGSFIASAADNTAVQVFQIETGEFTRELDQGPRAKVQVVKFSPDSALIATACVNGELCLYRGDTGDLLKKFLLSWDYSWDGIQFSPDSKYVTFASDNYDPETVRIIRLDTLQCVQEVESTGVEAMAKRTRGTPGASNAARVSLHFSSDSQTLGIVAKGTGCYALWNVETGICLREQSKESDLTKVFLPDGMSFSFVDNSSFMMAGILESSPTVVEILHLETGDTVHTLQGHEGTVRGTHFSLDGTLLGSFSEDNTAMIWSVDTGECLHLLEGHTDTVTAMSFSSDMNLFASASDDRTIRIWRADLSNGAAQSTERYDPVQSVILSPDGTYIASCTERGDAQVWEAKTGHCIHRFPTKPYVTRSLQFCLNSTFLSGCSSRHLFLWRVDTGQCVFECTISRGTTATFSPDGRYISTHGNTLCIFDLQADIFQGEFQGVDQSAKYRKFQIIDKDPICDVKFSPDSTFVATLTENPSSDAFPSSELWGHHRMRTLSIWRLETGELIRQLTHLDDQAFLLCISPNSEYIALCLRSSMLRIVRTTTLETHQEHNCVTYSSHPNAKRVAFSQDSRYLTWGSGPVMEFWGIGDRSPTQRMYIGFDPSRVEFDDTRSYLLTNFGPFSINKPCWTVENLAHVAVPHRRSGYWFNHENSWVMWNDIKFFWLPPGFRPVNDHCVEVSGPTVVIGSASGQASVFNFNVEGLLSQYGEST
ncbi:WD40-repeat-containing domain protein [Dactylonectria estremocensis]|uniref:WD40-repeat-containing domain protein n=1 Tax=Dactylonectria estremocensis TaxID=1079267 RepID=A0A9P9EM88_9HYPO|nr:WD40-repeat-containing domain protein [Dactylonectria estremocensis]